MIVVAEGEKIKIRPISLEDVPQFVKWWNDGELMASVGFSRGLGVTEAKLYDDFNEEISDPSSLRERRRYVVLDKVNDLPIGELVYGQLDLAENKCRIGIKICELSYQGKGFGKDALVTFILFLFNHFDLQKIEIDTLADNLRAYSLYKKVGFRETKKESKFWQDPDGIWHDVIFMEMEKPEFQY
ncbi:MAG: GNAT family protein [Firmicutes bacterium]|nr:GNAT family protein [Bacillota bacterium]MDD4264499.1 GNAT family protein [Bacillota bacterium]